jgi:hypothetical protein
MCTDSKDAAGVSSGAALSGILALVVAEREGGGSRRTERILADAGLSDDQIGALTGRDARQVRAIIDSATKVPVTASGHWAIER